MKEDLCFFLFINKNPMLQLPESFLAIGKEDDPVSLISYTVLPYGQIE